MNDQPAIAPRILVVDDNLEIHEDFHKILGRPPASGSPLKNLEHALFEDQGEERRLSFRIDSARQGQEALALVEKATGENDPYALVFLDVRMPPGWDGIETLGHLWKVCPEMQVVLCTAFSDYSWDDIIRQFGHTDNLLILKKPFENMEVLQVSHALTKKWSLARQARLRLEDLDAMVRERTAKLEQEAGERARVQEALRLSEEKFSTAFSSSPIPMAIQCLPTGRFLAANDKFVELTGQPMEELLRRDAQSPGLWADDAVAEGVANSGGRARNLACALRHRDGTLRNALLWTEPITVEATPCHLIVVEDVTEKLRLEAQLLQSQKLELVGRLVANVAHEVNNVLTVIQGHATLLHAEVAGNKSQAASAERILQASHRAATFTRQLLTFSRKQAVSFKPVRLAERIQGLNNLLGSSLGEQHALKLELAEGLPSVRASDEGFEQILMNLALNARDAMTRGGIITVSTSLAVLNERDAQRHPEARAGSFACLAVRDTGCGIPREMIRRIFDPFFTTKQVGKGTGLGLSMVQNLVQQHEGWIEVESEISRGSVFKIFLPVWAGPAVVTPDPPAAPAVVEVHRGSEVVLLVEDEPVVREMARLTLEGGGYRVYEAADGREALQVWADCPVGINVVLTDIVMPNGVSGGALARTLQERDPKLAVVCTSGYTPEYIEREIPRRQGVAFLPKPYLPRQLLATIRECLTASLIANLNAGSKAGTQPAALAAA